MSTSADTSLIVAQEIMNLIRTAGITMLEAQAALNAASAALSAATDLPFRDAGGSPCSSLGNVEPQRP